MEGVNFDRMTLARWLENYISDLGTTLLYTDTLDGKSVVVGSVTHARTASAHTRMHYASDHSFRHCTTKRYLSYLKLHCI